MKRLSVAALTCMIIFSACKKNGNGTPSSIGADHILTAFRIVSAQGDNTYQFGFDANDRPTVVRNLSQGTTIAGSAAFVFSNGGRLERMDLYKGEPTGTPYETINYSYDFDDLLVSESTSRSDGSNCYFCNHQYEYDEEGRLSKYTRLGSYYRRYEYEDDGNAIKTFTKPLAGGAETPELEFLKFDKLAPYYGVDSSMRIILRSMFWSNVFWDEQNPWTNIGEFPLPAMANNITKFKWNPVTGPQVVSLPREFNAQLQYNEDGYPIKATAKFSKQFAGSSPVEWTVYLTYKKLE